MDTISSIIGLFIGVFIGMIFLCMSKYLGDK